MSQHRLLVVDAPGGPAPSTYLPSLCAEFDVIVVWLAVEPPEQRARREHALRIARAAVPVDAPESLDAVLRRVAGEHPLDGIIAFSERVVHTAQRIAWERGLPANRPGTLRALQDKVLQRDLMAKAGLTVPQPITLTSENDCASAEHNVRFPAVLKPAIGMGSIATYLVEHQQNLRAIWREASKLVRSDTRIAQHQPSLLLEEQLVGVDPVDVPGLGDYVSVEALVWNGQPHILAVSDKLPLSSQFRENAHILPSVRGADRLSPIIDCAVTAHAALGITHGVTHTEIKLTPQGPRIIEVNGRVGGGVTEELKLAAEYDLPLQLARSAVGHAPDTCPAFTRYASFLTPQPPTGQHLVNRAPKASALLRDIPALVEVTHIVSVGQKVDSTTGTSSNLLKGFAVARDHSDLIELGRRITGPDRFTLTALDPETTGAAT